MGRKRYTEEFKREAVRQVTQPGSSAPKVAHDLQIHANLLHRWVRERAATPRQEPRAARRFIA
jgi:transposase